MLGDTTHGELMECKQRYQDSPAETDNTQARCTMTDTQDQRYGICTLFLVKWSIHRPHLLKMSFISRPAGPLGGGFEKAAAVNTPQKTGYSYLVTCLAHAVLLQILSAM